VKADELRVISLIFLTVRVYLLGECVCVCHSSVGNFRVAERRKKKHSLITLITSDHKAVPHLKNEAIQFTLKRRKLTSQMVSLKIREVNRETLEKE
jgi:hypothetical protein